MTGQIWGVWKFETIGPNMLKFIDIPGFICYNSPVTNKHLPAQCELTTFKRNDMKTKKLNKTETYALALNNITDLLNNTDLVAKSKRQDLLDLLETGIKFLAPTTATSTKAATGWQANSINANLIIRKAKSMRKRLEQQAMREYRFSRLTEAEMNTLLDIAEQITENKYDSIDEMPTLWDLIQPELGEDTANMIDKD